MHLWVARELPVGVQRGGAVPPLIVRLAHTAPGAALLSEKAKSDEAGVPRAAPVRKGQEAYAATPSPDRGARAGTVDTAGVAPHADLAYYPARELDVYPTLLTPLSIAYPVRASEDDRTGRALVMLSIDARGRVTDVTVMEGDPPDYFDDAARKTFEHAAFSPGRRNGIPVRSRVLIELSFDRRTAGAQPQ